MNVKISKSVINGPDKECVGVNLAGLIFGM